MRFHEVDIDGMYVIDLDPFIDKRGSFVRSYCINELAKVGIKKPIIQINHSSTSRVGAIRGMHFQRPPNAEVKMVRCISGEVFDVAIDLRSDSKTFLRWHGEFLTSENHKMMIIPEGFAHGFQVIKPNSELLYLHTASFAPELESGVSYNDEKIGIEWPLNVTDISDRDLKYNKIDNKFDLKSFK